MIQFSSPTLALFTGTRMAGLISAYMGQASLAKLTIGDDQDRLRFFVENVSKWCRRGMDALRFDIEVKGLDRLDLQNKNYLFVSNHMSYLDILVFSSKMPSVFITSVDMGEVFFLGTMAELGGSIFVERRNRNQVDRDLSNMTKTLKQGFNIVIYPEGTSTNGSQVLPFKKSLLMSAVEAGCDVVPVATKYMSIDGEPFSAANCDKVAWHGDMTFADHFLGLLKLKQVKVQLEFAEPIRVTPETSRGEIAERAWAAVQDAYFKDRDPSFEKSFAKRRRSMTAEKSPSANPDQTPVT